MSFSGKDETIVCKDCPLSFTFTVAEQLWYQNQGLEHMPKRCKACAANARAKRNGGGQATPTSASKPVEDVTQRQATASPQAKPLMEQANQPSKGYGGRKDEEDEHRPRKEGKKRRRRGNDDDDNWGW